MNYSSGTWFLCGCQRNDYHRRPPPPHTHTHIHTRTHLGILFWEIAPDQIERASKLCRYPPNNFNSQHIKYISTKTLYEVTNCKLHLAITCLSLHSTCDQSPNSLGKYSEYSVLARTISLLAFIRDIAGLHLIGTKNTLPAGFPVFFRSLQTRGRPSPRPQATCASLILRNIIF